MSDRSQLTDRKHHLPEIKLASVDGPVALQRNGRAVLALCIHDWSCEVCAREVRNVAHAAEEIGSWDCDVAIIVRGEPQPPAHPLPLSVRVLYDPDHKLERTAGLACPGVFIADQWADITCLRPAGDNHEFPALPQLISEVRYLATRCPECEGEAL